MKLEQHHIDGGTPGSVDSCALALMLKEHSGDDNSWIGLNVYEVNGVLSGMTKTAKELAMKFDRREPIEPQEVDLPITKSR